jgi:hypothetical protein
MIVLDTCENYIINGTEISLITNETAYGWHTVAEVEGQYYYLGDELCNIETAVGVWQDLNDRLLSVQELHSILVENGLRQK